MSHELPSFLIDAGELLQHVSRVVYRGSPLYYGRSSTNRYDDPAQAYGVLYLGRDLPTALMESVFHKHQWLADTKRSIALKEVQSRMVRAVGVMDDVLLADLTAPGVMAGYFGLTVGQVDTLEAPERIRKGMGQYPLPVVILARLAVSVVDQGRGLGFGLLQDAIRRTMLIAEQAGIRAMLTHPIDDEAARFHTRFGFIASPLREQQLLLLLKDARRWVR